MKKMKILICRILKAVHYRVYKCTAILHTPMGRTHGENSMSKLDNDAKRVANIYIWNYPCIKMPSHTTCRALRDRNHAEKIAKLNESCINEWQDIECVEHQEYWYEMERRSVT